MEILKICKRHGKLTKEQIYYKGYDGSRRCRLCISECWAKYLKKNKAPPKNVIEKKDMAIQEFFAVSIKFRDFSILNHGEDIFYVDSEKFIANHNHSYTRQVG